MPARAGFAEVQAHSTGEFDGAAVVAVNVDCLDGVDARALKFRHVDGVSYEAVSWVFLLRLDLCRYFGHLA